MSIRALSNQPCPDCKKETMHMAMKCRECGHINLTPSQHREVGYKKVVKGRRFKYHVLGQSQEILEQKILISTSKRAETLEFREKYLAEQLAIKNRKYQKKDQGVFGKGRRK